MKKRIIPLLLVIMLCLSGCLGEKAEEASPTPPVSPTATVKPTYPPYQTPSIEERLGTNLLKDCTFENGFNLLGMDAAVDGALVHKTIQYGESEPVWKIAQWWGKYNLLDGEEINTDTQYQISDTQKSVSIDKESHSVTLSLDSTYNFEVSPSTAPSEWPHLLLEQAVDTSLSSFKDAKSVTAKLEFTVESTDDLRTNENGLNAQFAWFIYIVDTNPESEGYGNFLWFGLNLYCPPKNGGAGYSGQDTAGGPGNYIYSLPSSDIFIGSVKEGWPVKFELNILPFVRKALEEAQENGFMMGTELDDCSISGTNIGWEVFDRWDVSIKINEIGIYRK